jgi:hypothetical protein
VGSVHVFGVNVEFSHGVYMGAYIMVMQYLHDVVGAEGVCLVEEVLCETGGWAVVVESTYVLIVS